MTKEKMAKILSERYIRNSDNIGQCSRCPYNQEVTREGYNPCNMQICWVEKRYNDYKGKIG